MADTKRTLYIYGKEVVMVKGKTTKKKQSRILIINKVEIPEQILSKYGKVHIMVDYMFVQGIQFLTTISDKYNFRILEALLYISEKGVKKENILKGIQKVINLYQSRGLVIEQISRDNEFECIHDKIRPVKLNIAAADEQVSVVERSIRTIKERTRC